MATPGWGPRHPPGPHLVTVDGVGIYYPKIRGIFLKIPLAGRRGSFSEANLEEINEFLSYTCIYHFFWQFRAKNVLLGLYVTNRHLFKKIISLYLNCREEYVLDL